MQKWSNMTNPLLSRKSRRIIPPPKNTFPRRKQSRPRIYLEHLMTLSRKSSSKDLSPPITKETLSAILPQLTQTMIRPLQGIALPVPETTLPRQTLLFMTTTNSVERDTPQGVPPTTNTCSTYPNRPQQTQGHAHLRPFPTFTENPMSSFKLKFF